MACKYIIDISMNKYIYKVRFVTLQEQKLCINMNYFNKEFNYNSTTEKIQIMKSGRGMNASCLFLRKFYARTSDL